MTEEIIENTEAANVLGADSDTGEGDGGIAAQLQGGPIGGFWRRLLAFAIDGIVMGIIGFMLGSLFFDHFAQMGAYGRLVGFGVALFYFGLFNSSVKEGQTIGKKIMKIRVVGRDGEYISLARSLVRAAILIAPFFLNEIILPASQQMSLVGGVIGYVIFAFGGAIIYLYTFNRRTRQSLHDLVVGSFVVKANAKGPVMVSPVWKPHLVVTGSWFFVVILLCISMYMVAQMGIFPELLAVQKSIESTGKVHAAGVGIGKNWGFVNGKKSESTYFYANAFWKTRPGDYKAAASEVASIILSEYPGIMDKNILSVTVIYGYDIGIARGWRDSTCNFSPQEWINVINEK